MTSALFLSLIILVAFNVSAVARSSGAAVAGKECDGRIYEPKEVTLRPKIGQRTSPVLTPEALAHNMRGLVILSAVLCRTGRVTDINVIKGLPFGMTERAIEAARQIDFAPAEKDGEPVSEVIRLEYEFHYLGEKGPPAQQPIAGRMIEDVEFWGLRSKQADEILALLKTRPGGPYDEKKVTADLQSLLALGLFDPEESKIRVDEGFRRGVRVIFELVERAPK